MYDSTRFNEIFLTERDRQILYDCAEGKILLLYPSEVQHLLELCFVYEYDMTGRSGLYAVTPQGRLYYEFCREREKREKKDAQGKTTDRLLTIISAAIAAIGVVVALLKE